MWHRIFTALPLAFLTSIFLLPIGRTTVSHDIFASAVGAMNSGDDHGIFCLSNDFCPYFTTTFPFPPLPCSVSAHAGRGTSPRSSLPRVGHGTVAPRSATLARSGCLTVCLLSLEHVEMFSQTWLRQARGQLLGLSESGPI